jgi:glutamate synthase (NADPH/NADH) small chain
VALGYGEHQARLEAERCLGCKNEPCVKGCPVGVPIPRFIAEIQKGNFKTAVDIIKETNLLPAVCGRVCPQETQCQARCTLGKIFKSTEKAVAIGRLERFVADRERENGKVKVPAVKPATGKKIAIIGSGPAGLTMAADAVREGHAVTVFEALHKPGGVMVYGIPEFRLPKAIVQAEVDILHKMGVRFKTNYLVGRTRTIAEFLEADHYDAVFIGAGAGIPKFLGCPGENLVGVFSANEYLTRANLMKAYDTKQADTPMFRSKTAVVIGGGNVAMDAARREEIERAIEEGIIFNFLRNPKRFFGDGQGKITGLELQKFELGEPDDSGRRSPVAIPGSEYIFECDTVIVALGNESNPLMARTTEHLLVGPGGRILVNKDQKTSLEKVYAGAT